MPLFVRVVLFVTLTSCGVSNPTFLPPPGNQQPPYPTFEVATFDTNDHNAVGLPACDGTLLERDYFITCHDDDWLIARWVGYVLTPADLEGTTERTDNFRSDPDLPNGRRAEPSDYEEPTYDRGHMAPAGDFTRNRDAMSSTFYLSNVSAQHPELNQGEWLYLESTVRNRVRVATAGWIFTGNLFLDASGEPTSPQLRIGRNNVAVPTHLFKAILLQYPDNTIRMSGYVLPNQSANIGRWFNESVTLDDVEWLTGLDLYDALPDDVEDEIEALNWSL